MNRKPENLCRTAEDQIKISDFGVSYLITEQGTKKRSGLGTPAFTAPEALSTINGNSFSPQLLDIWALGITLVRSRISFLALTTFF